MQTFSDLVKAAQDLATACQRAKELLRLFGAPPDQLAFLEAAIEEYHGVLKEASDPTEDPSGYGDIGAWRKASGC